jgi:hypothetical protein
MLRRVEDPTGPVVDPARGSALNEREQWREMVRWSGGRIVEERGVLLVSGPSAYLRVATRVDPRVEGAAVVARAIEFFGAEPTGFIELCGGASRDGGVTGFEEPAWTTRSPESRRR